MIEQEIKKFQESLGSTNWHMDFNQFCERTGFVGEYAKDKWMQWKELNHALGQFDAGTLAKITGG